VPDDIQVPDDLTALEPDELSTLHERLVAAFDALMDETGDNPTPEQVGRLTTLAEQVESVRADLARRDDAAQQAQAQAAQLRDRVHADTPPATDPAPDGDQPAGDSGDPPAGEVAPDAVAAAAAQAATAAVNALSPALADLLASRQAPAQTGRAPTPAPHQPSPDLPGELVVTAGADIPGFGRGDALETRAALADAFLARGRGLPVTHGAPQETLVASVRNEFDETADERTSPDEVADLFNRLRGPDRRQVLTDPEALVAGGGWCAPSETRYTFFDVACEDGGIDLPTFGVTRGGIRYPVSPSMADVFTGEFTNATNPWLWTEADDILTVTGAPNKPCVRVPCADLDERRLECYGICLTAGNLTDNAWPEQTQNFLGLLLSAHERAMNLRFIQTMVDLSTSPCVSGGGFGTGGSGTVAPLLGGSELAAIDYRTRYGMCDTDIVEQVLPSWIKGPMRADLAKRAGVDLISVSDTRLMAWFTDRNIRPQFIRDWQVFGDGQPGGATPLTNWPTSVQFLMYAAGTFIKGNGLTLDLGIVRDSVLNAENDFTAAWSEECHLIARVGHESRCYTLAFCTDGTTGASDLTACGL
jgi:hypothetical protein